MIDNIIIKLENVNNIKEIISIIKPFPKLNKQNRLIQYYFGKLKNLRIILNPYVKTLVIIGSLSKYLYGNNDISFSRSDIEKCIIKLSDILNVNLNDGYVYRLEISDNIVLKHNVNKYLKYLSFSKRLKRKNYKGTVYFSNKRKALVFYDKSKELKKNKIKPLFDNVLRYEIRFYKNLAKQLKEKEIRVYMLYEENFYMKLCKIWYYNYGQIIKLSFDKRVIQILGLNANNIDELVEEIQSLPSTKKQNVRNKIIKSLSINDYENELLSELSMKIKNCILHFR